MAVLRIDPASARLHLHATLACGGRTPRCFTPLSDARWPYVLNESSDPILQLALDASGLTPRHTGRQWPCGSPVCMVFAPDDLSA